MDLGKSPTSLLLLQTLAGPKGRQVSKEELHHQLTGCKYNPMLHDDRLHKLLKRLSSKIQQNLAVVPWEMPGNNQVLLKLDLEVI